MNVFLGKNSIMSILEPYLVSFIRTVNITTFRQGSIEWHENRKHTIGSSELNKATGTAKSRQSIIDRKLGLSSTPPRIVPIVWGNDMEPMTKLFVEVLLGFKIYTVNGSIINRKYVDENGKPTNSDSPDGLGIIVVPVEFCEFKVMPTSVDHLGIRGCTNFGAGKVKRAIVDKIFSPILFGSGPPIGECIPYAPIKYEDDNKNIVELIAHHEFKSPITRNLEKGKISDEYLFQKLAGIEMIEITQTGMFSEAKFDVVEKFSYRPVMMTDEYRTFKNHSIYFAAILFYREEGFGQDQEIKLHNPKDSCLACLDYTTYPGPYMYNFDGQFVFNANKFAKGNPSNPEEFTEYAKKLVGDLAGKPGQPHYYALVQIRQFSVNIVRKVNGFMENLHPHCIELLQEVEKQRNA